MPMGSIAGENAKISLEENLSTVYCWYTSRRFEVANMFVPSDGT